ncbi:hypothetical protein PGT21_014984 [Puccinia graminis f. sp. tritici]|uniref:Uncharacterized protein n=1 Tax=Puccinia graminis f. sp. tritici TaxID=56615 RepID=A0A5B0PXK9_PUCGR|nr:hypothetical protein PGTUg99_017047 [Puccinia graminis f. sp. tritici]KAA1105668.1 hypothetical protein PGT21_014984 [Puccinia graminis f. sp. tritici]
MVDDAAKRSTRSNHHKAPKGQATKDNLSSNANTLTEAGATVTTQTIPTAAISGSLQPSSGNTERRDVLELDTESNGSDAFKDLAENDPKENSVAPKENPGNILKYKSILSNVPKITTNDNLSIIHKESAINQDLVEDPIVDTLQEHGAQTTELALRPPAPPVPKSDKSILWDKIAEAVAANDKANTDFFIRLYSQISDTASPLKPDILRSRSNDAASPQIISSAAKKPSDKTSIIFVRGSLPKHFDVGFTPYFDKNIKELRGPIPLTIFDKKWQEDAIQYHTNKRSKGDEKDGNYTGYEYPNEWTQTFAKWTANHCKFHVTFRDLYMSGSAMPRQ